MLKNILKKLSAVTAMVCMMSITAACSDSNKPAKGNKYTVWWGYDCGWGGAFANYCMEYNGYR